MNFGHRDVFFGIYANPLLLNRGTVSAFVKAINSWREDRLSEAQRFDEGDDPPSVVDGNGGMQSRLAAAGYTVTDGFK